ncbi:MAG: hypothetical protein KDB00_05215 [Planctomycetales bacterium]|nr:hypothetical protein [Planctomycetales bacterium]
MRKWKIRTKMIAGLSGLALVILVLVYSSWSQLARDRELATEIGQLAEEFHYAHELNRWAERLSRSHTLFQRIREADHKMIEADRMLELAEIERSSLRQQHKGMVSDSFERLEEFLKAYNHILAARDSTQKNAGLLVDRGDQKKSLEDIEELLVSAQHDWADACKHEHEIMPLEYYPARLDQRLGNLVTLTNEHSYKIQQGMKQFGTTVHKEHRAKRNSFWFFTGLSAFLILFLAWQFWTLIVVPFRTLFRGSQLIASGHHQHKILLGTDDEIGSMADTVNDITDRFNQAVARVTLAKQRAEQEVRDRTREVIQNEQLASVGFLAAGVAHEINNPLGAIAWGAEALEETLNELPEDELARLDQEFLGELRTNLGLIQSEAFRCKGITKRLLNFSRLSDSTRDQEDISELVSRVVSMVGKVGEYRCKTLRMHEDNKVIAYCNAQEIQQVVLNLVSNALESVDTDGQVDVHVRNEIDPLTGAKEAVVIVEDNGCGMDQEVMDHLFEPFFTRRRDDTGTGLGLSISYRIVSLHHGSLTPYSEGEGRGSKMVLRLPTAPATREPYEKIPALIENNEPNSSTKWNDVQKVA